MNPQDYGSYAEAGVSFLWLPTMRIGSTEAANIAA